MKLRKGLIKRIHVSQVNLRANMKDNGNRPVFTVQMSGKPHYGTQIDIKGSSKLISRPLKPLKCGARIWIETTAEVELI